VKPQSESSRKPTITVIVIAVLALSAVIALVEVTRQSVNSSTSSQNCINQSSSSSTSSSGPRGIASAVTPNVYFNNSIYQGPPVTFTVMPGSHATMVANVSYPWQNVKPPPTQEFCIDFSFTIGPFPANSNVSTIPNWMHVSLSAPSVEIPYESSASVNLVASVDGTAPQNSGASFLLLIHYLDPESGNSVIGSYVVSVQTPSYHFPENCSNQSVVGVSNSTTTVSCITATP